MRRDCLSIVLLVMLATAAAVPAARAASASKPAPPFTVRTLDGRTLRLGDFKGRAVVLDFWATWCVPCRAAMPHLDRMQQHFRDRGLVVIGLSVDDSSPQEVRAFAERLGVHFRLAMASESVLDLYGPIRSIPTTIYIDRRGEIVRRVVGYVDGDTMEGFAAELFEH